MNARCLSCLGRKTLLSLGNMQKTCPYCFGLGYIKEENKELVTSLAEVLEKPKRGRKRKVFSEKVLQC